MKKIYTGTGATGYVSGVNTAIGWLVPLLLIFLSSCRITRERCNQLYPPIETTSVDSIIMVKETIYDTTVVIQPDEGILNAVFECDSANQVLIKELTTINGQRVKLNLQTKRNNNTLQAMFQCNVDSMGVYVAFKSRDTSLTVTHRNTEIQLVERAKEYTKGEMFVLSVGPWCIGFVGLLILALIIYICWKVFTVATPQGAAISAGGGLLKTAWKFLRGGAILIVMISICSFTTYRFKKGDWVYWQEVNASGQKIVVIGKVLSKDIGAGTYRLLTNEGWKMHLKKEKLSLVPEK